jgi:hypothetical protein
VAELVNQNCGGAVRGHARADRDPASSPVAQAGGALELVAVGHGVADLLGEGLERGDELGVRVALDLAAGRRERHGLAAPQRLGLGEVEHRRLAEERPPALLAGRLVDVPDAHRGEDPQAALALAHAAVE